MHFASLNRLSICATAFLAAAGLTIFVGCQLSPEATEQQPAELEPAEQTADPAQEHGDAPAHERHQPPQQQDPHQPPAGEQQPPAGDPMMPPQGETVEVDDETFDKFVDALVATHEHEQEAQRQMQQAESQQEAHRIQQEAIADIQRETEEAGLDFQEFMQIGQQVERDPELQERLFEELEDRGKEDLLQPPAQQQPQQREQPTPDHPAPDDGGF